MVSFPLGVRRECIFSLIFLESRFLSVAHPTVANLSWLGLGSLVGLSSAPVFSHVPLLLLDYRWSHNPPTYWRTVIPSWYWTHTNNSALNKTSALNSWQNMSINVSCILKAPPLGLAWATWSNESNKYFWQIIPYG